MAKTAMKSYSLAEMKNKYIGKKGTQDRDQYGQMKKLQDKNVN